MDKIRNAIDYIVEQNKAWMTEDMNKLEEKLEKQEWVPVIAAVPSKNAAPSHKRSRRESDA